MRIERSPRRIPRVLGIDASLTSTGVCYRGEANEIKVGLIEGGDMRGGYRLSNMRRRLRDLLNRVRPDLVVLEDYAVNKRMGANTVLGLAEWGGVIRMEVWEHGIGLLAVRPSTMKMVAGGKGNAKKPEVARALHQNLGTLVTQNDAADAFGLMVTGEVKLRSPLLPVAFLNTARIGKLGEFEIVSGAKMKLIAE